MEEITPGGWPKVCQGNKEGRSVLGSVDSSGEGMGGGERGTLGTLGGIQRGWARGEGLWEGLWERVWEGPRCTHQHNLPSLPTSTDTWSGQTDSFLRMKKKKAN